MTADSTEKLFLPDSQHSIFDRKWHKNVDKKNDNGVCFLLLHGLRFLYKYAVSFVVYGQCLGGSNRDIGGQTDYFFSTILMLYFVESFFIST